jgi:hypothetical protein
MFSVDKSSEHRGHVLSKLLILSIHTVQASMILEKYLILPVQIVF